ncbi:type II toxin-antitoxin system VapC family toxin [Frankia sp. Cr2]|uniref:type II toxin-antitoxin system VapC family toxin n=1 Tax=Frankia sp. Cr2 TaxID=3073932 RepID=UPI002AD28528|nr:type II toxin-antitoxin system VapC family toxin [Frankia sp. Cr2]
MIVVDASVFAFCLLDDGGIGERCRSVLRADDRWIAPEHWMVEVLSAIRGNLLAGKISQRHAADALEALAALEPVVPHTRVLLPRMWELRANLTAYDAAYAAAAETYGCVLVTTDGRMARCGALRCPVEIIT